ncbi:hypothetical protein FHE74_09525 [Corynebacterium tapiri]|uniref:Peptidoglycan recognition protein family domain-containing protein n=1 Tax=Corynebacterium tapiri TaxID=1448266 RepID=A0A5C4U1R7_9CORY|nr:hypothetical protein FHE74_09525 [Corynebacterium tapiri]
MTVAAVGTAAVFGGNSIYQTQAAGGGPIPVDQQTLAFDGGENVVVDDAAIASQGGTPGPKTVKEFTSASEFSMFALTWPEGKEFASYVRAQNDDGSWGPWYAAAPMEETPQNGTMGTDLIYVEPTKAVQVSVAGVDLGLPEADATPADTASLTNVPEDAPRAGAGIDPASQPQPKSEEPKQEEPKAEAPKSDELAPIPSNYGEIKPVADSEPISADQIDVVLIDGNTQENGVDHVADTSSTTGMPDVISRAQWGADESLRFSNPTINDVTAVTVHHTAGSNNYTEAQAPGIVRGIQTYHGRNLGWTDIGYNALVDKYGNIYEGRAGGLDRGVEGAHVGGFNMNTWGVSVLGNYEKAQPTQASIDALGELAGWKAAISGFDPTGYGQHYAEFGFGGSKFAQGQGATFPNINAHRDFHYNTCPGEYLYAQMDTIRSKAKQKYNAVSGKTQPQTSTSTQSSPSATKTTTPSASTSTTPTTQPASTTQSTKEPVKQQTSSTSELLKQLQSGNASAIMAAVGTLAAVILSALSKSGVLNSAVRNAGDVEIVEGLAVSKLPPIIDGIVKLSGDSNIERKWQAVSNTYGDVLGQPTGGTAHTGVGGPDLATAFALFDNGIIVDDSEAGTHALWGEIADAWAGQGYDLGPLGLPTSEEVSIGNGQVRATFEGGSITYDSTTNKVNISLDQ